MKKLFLFLILGASTLLMGQDSLEVLEVEIQDSYKEIKLIPGKVLPTQISNLAFEIPGIVYKINADIGDRFAKGDVLAELDSRELMQISCKLRQGLNYLSLLLIVLRTLKKTALFLRKNLIVPVQNMM